MPSGPSSNLCNRCGCDLEERQSSYLLGDERVCHECATEAGWYEADDGAENHKDCHNCGYAGNPPEADECLNCEAILIPGQEYCEDCHEPLVAGEFGLCADCGG